MQRRLHLRRATRALRDAGMPVKMGDEGDVGVTASQCPDCGADIIWRTSVRATGSKRVAMAIDMTPAPDGTGDLYVTGLSYRIIPTVELEMMHVSARRALHRFHRATCVALHGSDHHEGTE